MLKPFARAFTRVQFFYTGKCDFFTRVSVFSILQISFSFDYLDPIEAANQQERMETVRRRLQEQQDARAAKFLEDKMLVSNRKLLNNNNHLTVLYFFAHVACSSPNSDFLFPSMPVSLTEKIRHSHLFIRLKIFHLIYTVFHCAYATH